MAQENSQQFEYRAEMKQLLHLIIHSLYTHPEIFLRELISNSSDALNKVRFRKMSGDALRDADQPLEIRISLDSKQHLFTISDTGIGMTRDDLINKIGTIASSGTLEFLKQLKEGQKNPEETLIGQFGVGFYAVFMVADEVTVETCAAGPDEPAWRWQSTGEGAYTISAGERKTRGTTITLRLKESGQEFARAYKIREIITKYSNFVTFPIFLENDRINTVEALWHKKPDEVKESERTEFYKFISGDPDAPLAHFSINVEGSVNFKALLFVPQHAPHDLFNLQHEKSLSLYSNKVLIQHDCKELLPEYLRFLKGVVDTSDLPLNVSREVTQSSPAMQKIRNIIISKTLAFLQTTAEENTAQYRTFYKNFGPLLKTGINSDFENREKIVELLRFETSKTGEDEILSLKEYCARMPADQKEIYFLAGEQRESVLNNPNLEIFRKNGWETLLLTEPVDIFIIPAIGTYAGKNLVSIDQADIAALSGGKIEKIENSLHVSLINLFKETLKDVVEDVVVSKRLVDSPATLVTGKNGMNTPLEKMMRLMQKDFKPAKKIMEINLDHPLLQNLSRLYLTDSAHPLLRSCIFQLFDSVSLLDGTIPSVAAMVKRMNTIMEQATK
ncbi:MAG: molecular chaperone HtpG [Candidatus Omnitrophica bacterium]|nr:molecular chaperone HtpG [Candidatus Omnitrophota bacterium]